LTSRNDLDLHQSAQGDQSNTVAAITSPPLLAPKTVWSSPDDNIVATADCSANYTGITFKVIPNSGGTGADIEGGMIKPNTTRVRR